MNYPYKIYVKCLDDCIYNLGPDGCSHPLVDYMLDIMDEYFMEFGESLNICPSYKKFISFEKRLEEG